MPALLTRAASTAADTRVLDSRQLRDASDSVSAQAASLFKRLASSQLRPRQSNGYIIPTEYAGIRAGPPPGTVVGIVLGSIVGFLLIMWLLWAMTQGTGFIRASTYEEEDVVVRRRSRSPRRTRSHRSHRPEMASRSPRRERVIRTERIVREGGIPLPREPSRMRETIIVEDRHERRVDGDNIVEVIEENSEIGIPPPRRKSRRNSGYRRDEYSDI